MPEFRLLFLRANRLAHWESFEADDALTAVHIAAARPSDDIMELWSDAGRIGVFRPLAGHSGRIVQEVRSKPDEA